MATKTMDQLFEVYDVIGTGAFANVRRVRRKEDGRLLVLKTLRARVDALSDEERRDMINEVDLLSELNHPNVIQYFGSFVENSNQHIVMEYAAGGALVNVLNQARGPLPEDQIWEWFSQMCIALRYVHNCNILHRDIKPQNILLWGPRGRVVKLADFGIAKVLSNSSPAGAQLVGTPYYLAPEICSGGVYTQRSDVWALACVLYEMLSLSKPFQSPNLPQLALQIIREPHQPLNSIALRTYSDAIRDLTDLMLQKDSDDRPDMHQLCAIPVVRHKMQLWDAIRDTLIQTEAREVQQEADTYILSRRENMHNEQGAGPSASDSSQAYACAAPNSRVQGSAAQAVTSPCTGSTSASETTDPSKPSSGTPFLPSEAHAGNSSNNVLLKCSIDTSGPESALATTFTSPTNSSRSGSPRRINRNVQKMSVLEQNAVFRRNSGGASAAASAGDALSPRSHAEPDGGGPQCVRTFFSTGSPRAVPGPGQLGTLSLGGSFSRFRSSTGIGSGLNESRDSGMSFSSMSDSEARVIMSLFIRDGVRVFRWGSGQRRPKLDERIYLASMQHNEWVNVESIACTRFEEEESETHHTLVLTEDGQVLSLGCNSSGQLGISPASLEIAALRQLRHIRYFSDRSICIASVACGSAFSAAVSRDGKVYMWGDLSDLGDHSELELKFEACGDLAQDSVFAEGMSETSSLVSEVNDRLRYGFQSSRPKAALTVDTGSSRSRMSLLSSDDEGSVRRGPSASSLGMSLFNVSSRSKTGRCFSAEGNLGEDGVEEDYVRRGRSTSTLSISSFNLATSTANENVSKRMLQSDEDSEDSVSRGPSASILGMASLNVSSRASNLKAAMPRSSQLGQMDSLSPERTNDGGDKHRDEAGAASPPQGWPAWAKEQFYRNQSKPPGENPFRSPRHGDAETTLFFGNSMSLSTTSSSFASTAGITDDKRKVQVQDSFSDQGFLIEEVEEDDEDEEVEGDTEEEEEEKIPEPHSAPLGIVRNLTQSLRNMGKSPHNRLASAATTTSAPERWRGLFRPNSFSSILSKSSRSLLRRRSSSSSMASQNSSAADVEQKERNVDNEHEESSPPMEPIRVGKRVHLVSKRLADCGVVRFMGRTSFARGIWVGIELDEPMGKNDGTVKGKRYFSCAESHGVFVQPQNVLVVAKSGEVPAWELFEHTKENRSQPDKAANRRGSSRSYGNGQSGVEEDNDAAADGQPTFDPLSQSSRSSRSGEESPANQVRTTLSLSSAEDVTVRRTQSNEDSQYVVEDHLMSPDGTVTEPRWVHALSTSFAIEVACGTNFACVLTREGRLFTWGQNDFGQLGLGHDDEQAHPTMVDLGAESVVKSMAVGEAHVLVITGSNNLYAWGRGCEGQLGLDREIYDEPNPDPSIVDAFPGKALSIAAGRYHSAGVTDDGEVYTWGEGDSGQLGLGDLESQRMPTLVTSLGRNGADVKVVQVTCGAAHTVALTETRAVYVWGNDQRGANPKLLPQNVDALSGSSVRDLCCGSFETYALCRLENPQDGL